MSLQVEYYQYTYVISGYLTTLIYTQELTVRVLEGANM